MREVRGGEARTAEGGAGEAAALTQLTFSELVSFVSGVPSSQTDVWTIGP
jgi:hypothetical protein